MGNRIEGNLVYKTGSRLAIVVARTNSLVTGRLLAGALDALRQRFLLGAPDGFVLTYKKELLKRQTAVPP